MGDIQAHRQWICFHLYGKQDHVVYYVNQDIPVLAILEDGEAVLVTGFNEFNVVIMEPSTGKLYKKGMNDATTWFAENGNHFISYMKIEN